MTAKITFKRGDITVEKVDAIVNAANSSLLGGGGVDGAIHLAGGPAILAECRTIRDRQGGCDAGQAVITTGGDLPARYVIHTVGPVWRGGGRGDPGLLAACSRNSLALAAEHKLETVAFPSISTGAFGYPVAQAAGQAMAAVNDALRDAPSLKEVRFVLFSQADLETYQSVTLAAAISDSSKGREER